MSEKRAYSRFNVQLAAQYKASNLAASAFRVTMVDIGATGMCFLCDDLLDVGQIIALQIQLNHKEAVNFKTEIIWLAKANQTQYKVGVKIVDATTSDEIKFVHFYCEKMMTLSKNYKKILLIDDEKDMVHLLQIELEKENYNVVYAYEGEEGFNKYLSERPDLIIMDVAMPNMSGQYLCRKIRREENDTKTPIVMLTAKNEDADRIIGSVVGAQKYITKPFDMQALLSTVEDLLNRNELHHKGGTNDKHHTDC